MASTSTSAPPTTTDTTQKPSVSMVTTQSAQSSSNSSPSTSASFSTKLNYDAGQTSAQTPASSSSSSASTSTSTTEEKQQKEKDDSMFECNICLDTAKDAVVSVCGHLFCWPCLHQWLETRPFRQLCPVCKAMINKDKVIPLYGRGSTKQEDPRTKVPPRPAGQRVEPEEPQGFRGFGFGDNGFHMSFGIGTFPLGFFTSLNLGDPRPNAAPRGTTSWEEEQFLSKLFIWVAIIFAVWLILA